MIYHYVKKDIMSNLKKYYLDSIEKIISIK